MSFKASAPGSLMLLGEYAVLHGKPALVCAVNKRISVTLTPRPDNNIFIASALGELATDLSNLSVVPPFQFVCAVLKKFQKQLPSGFDLKIEADFSDQVGFASSAAVTVATLKALFEWLDLSFPAIALARLARSIIREVQGLGSGADVAACVYGGVIAYRAKPFAIEQLPYQFPITVMYSGAKTPTTQAVKQVTATFIDKPKLFQHLLQSIGHCALLGKQAVYEQNWFELGKLMNIQQGLMEALGVNTPQLSQLIQSLRAEVGILGAKISGSGLGDCVIGLGKIPHEMGQLLVEMTPEGVCSEKI